LRDEKFEQLYFVVPAANDSPIDILQPFELSIKAVYKQFQKSALALVLDSFKT
jgi:hypothetical protein